MYYFYRMYRKSDINICLKKKANVQKVLCSINPQKQESVSVGHIFTVTKKQLNEFCIQLEALQQQQLVQLYLHLDLKIGDASYLLNIAYIK